MNFRILLGAFLKEYDNLPKDVLSPASTTLTKKIIAFEDI
jgi:hypothetical protein